MSNIRAQKSQHQSSLRYPIASYENEYFFTCRDNKLGKTVCHKNPMFEYYAECYGTCLCFGIILRVATTVTC